MTSMTSNIRNVDTRPCLVLFFYNRFFILYSIKTESETSRLVNQLKLPIFLPTMYLSSEILSAMNDNCNCLLFSHTYMVRGSGQFLIYVQLTYINVQLDITNIEPPRIRDVKCSSALPS